MKRFHRLLLAIITCILTGVPAEAQQVEYFWDTDPGVGQGQLLQSFTGTTATINANLDVRTLSEGIHQLGLRAINGTHHSSTYYRTFYIPATSHEVKAIEYYFDEDPGVGRGTRMSATMTGETLNMAFAINTEDLAEGVHRIGLRVLTDGTWSETKVRQFLVRRYDEKHVVRLEYFWDEDPGTGCAYVVDITPGQEVTINFEADMFGLEEGTHTLGLRAMSGSKGWSPVEYVPDIVFEGWDQLQQYLNSLRDSEDLLAGGTYTRQFRNKEWQSLYVPFPLSHRQWANHFDVARINGFYQYDDDGDGVVDRQVLEAIMVRPDNGTLRPNYPYIIRAKTTATFNFDIDPQKVVAQETNSYSCSTMEARYTFTGNYDHLTGLRSAGFYRLRGGTLSLPDNDEEELPPFRWYLTIDDLGNQLDQSASRIDLRVVGEETGIENLNSLTPDPSPKGEWSRYYDLQGRRVATMPHSSLKKGVYIVNGKKKVVK